MEDFLNQFESEREAILATNSGYFDRNAFLEMGGRLERFLFLPASQLDELFTIFAEESGGMIDKTNTKDIFEQIFFQNITSAEENLQNDNEKQVQALGNLKYILNEIKMKGAKSINNTSGKSLKKVDAMNYISTQNFDLKMETIIILEKMETDPFNDTQLDAFIKTLETMMLEDLNQSVRISTTDIKKPFNLTQSMQFDGSTQASDNDLYSTMVIDDKQQKPSPFKQKSLTTQQTITSKDLSASELPSISPSKRKEWLLRKIMSLNVSESLQLSLADGVETVFRLEDETRQQLEKRIKMLDGELHNEERNNQERTSDQNRLLEELEKRETALVSLESQWKRTNKQLEAAEEVKRKTEANFIKDVLALQKTVDTGLLQIEKLEKENKKLKGEKDDLEEMVSGYKTFTETCKKRAKEIEEEKNGQLKELRRQRDRERVQKEKEVTEINDKFAQERQILEQTIQELLFKNKSLQEDIDSLREQLVTLETNGDISKNGVQALNLSLLNSTFNNNTSAIKFLNETSMIKDDKRFMGSMSILEELDRKYDDKNNQLDNIREEDEDENPTTPNDKNPNQPKEPKGPNKAALLEKISKLEDKNERMADQIKRLHDAQKKTSEKLFETEQRLHEVEEENENLLETQKLLEKELEISKKKLEDKKAEEDWEKREAKIREDFEKLLEEKNRKIVELENKYKQLQEKQKVVPAPLPVLEDVKKSEEPMKIEKKNLQNSILRSKSNLFGEQTFQIKISDKDQLKKSNTFPVPPDSDQKKVPIDGSQINEENLPIELMDNYNHKREKSPKPHPNSAETLGPRKRPRKSQRMATLDLKNIDFGIPKKSPSKPAHMHSLVAPKSTVKFRTMKAGSKMGSKLKTVLEKKYDVPSTVKKIEYSYDYLNIRKFAPIMQTIKKHEGRETDPSKCLSDNVYRLNRWKKKKNKILVVTQYYIYIFTTPKEVKRIFSYRELRSIITRGSKDNFICFRLKKDNDEMLDYFKKNELILFMSSRAKRLGLKIPINSKASTFSYLNTENKKQDLDPNKLTNYKPMYNLTFNRASEMHRLMNLSVLKKGFFGMKQKYQKYVALASDFGLVVFSAIEWNVEKFIPFGGTKICQHKADKKLLLLVLSDKTEVRVKFESKAEAKRYVKIIGSLAKNLS